MALIIYIALELKKFSLRDACRIKREAAKIAALHNAKPRYWHDYQDINFPINY